MSLYTRPAPKRSRVIIYVVRAGIYITVSLVTVVMLACSFLPFPSAAAQLLVLGTIVAWRTIAWLDLMEEMRR